MFSYVLVHGGSAFCPRCFLCGFVSFFGGRDPVENGEDGDLAPQFSEVLFFGFCDLVLPDLRFDLFLNVSERFANQRNAFQDTNDVETVLVFNNLRTEDTYIL